MRSRGYYFQYAKTDLGRIFERKYAEKYFPERKSPNHGTKMVADENNYRSSAPHHAKTSECQRAGPKLGGRGGIPPRLFASRLSLEKAWIPRPGPGGKPRRRFQPAPVPPTGGYLPPNRHHPRRAAVLTGGGIYCKSVCRQGIVGMPPHSQAGGHDDQADGHAQEEGVEGQVHKVPCQNGNGPG